MQKRIYVVIQKGTSGEDGKRLVEASSQAQAIRHCAKNVYTAKVATARDVAHLSREGLQVENAAEEAGAEVTQAEQAEA